MKELNVRRDSALIRFHPSIHAMVGEQAAASPDSIAVSACGVDMSYRELETRSDAYADLLIRRGVAPGALVGICLERGPELLPSILGVLKAGAGYVPLDPGFPVERLRFMVTDAALTLVITDSVCSELAIVAQDRQLRVDGETWTAAPASSHHLPRVQPDARAYVIYTSGTTGTPKGVAITHGAVCNFLASMKKSPGITADDVLLAVTTLSFDIAVLELLLPLTVGARIVLVPRRQTTDGLVLREILDQSGITIMQATPSTWQLLLESGWPPKSGLRALCGGEPLPIMLARKLTAGGVELWNMYGPTETTVWSTIARVVPPIEAINIGRPIDNTQIWILDEQLRLCATGVEGEICIGGEGVASGYLNRPDLTADRFIPDTFGPIPDRRVYRTGDLGRRTAEGEFEHLGRMDFQVKIRGHRVELGEIEFRLAEYPGVARAVAVAQEESTGVKRLLGYVVAKTGEELDLGVLRASLRAVLPEYMLPQHVILLEEMPLLPNGKIDRKSLSQLDHGGSAVRAVTKYVPASTDAERALVEIWESVLDVKPIGVLDDFSSLGGHSIHAATMMARVEVGTGYKLPIEALFDRPTIRALASAITSNLELSGGVIVPLRSGQLKPTLVLIAGVGGHVFAYHQFAHALPVHVPVYGMKAIGVEGNEPALDSVPEIAARYVEEILAVESEGPFVVAGYSVGARIALGVALGLEAKGRSVPRVISLDMYAPGHPKKGTLVSRIRFQMKQATQNGWRGFATYLKGRLTSRFQTARNDVRHELERLGLVPAYILRRVGDGLAKASANYLPTGKVKGRIINVVCTRKESWQHASLTTSSYGWEAFTQGGVDTLYVDASHLELFNDRMRNEMVVIFSEALLAVETQVAPLSSILI
jgi:amino acid adenylation domain-containing protein